MGYYTSKLAGRLEKIGAFNWEEEEDRRAYNNAANDPTIADIDNSFLTKTKIKRDLAGGLGAMALAGGLGKHLATRGVKGLPLKMLAKNKLMAAGGVGLGAMLAANAIKNHFISKKYEKNPEYRRFVNIGNRLDDLGVGTRGRDRDERNQTKQQIANLAAAGIVAHGMKGNSSKD